jgi:hypothetical protein
MSDPNQATMVSQREAYQAFLARAQKLAAHEITAFRADAWLAYHNVKTGVMSVLSRKAELAPRLTAAEILTLEKLPTLGLAVMFAASRVNRLLERSPNIISKKLIRARKIRRILLGAAEACVEAELLEAVAVEKIKAGTGLFDTAQDCVDLAQLYQDSAILMENTPAKAKPELVKEAEALGSELTTMLTPGDAPLTHNKVQELQDAVVIRDRMWSLLQSDHVLLWQAGTLLYGKKAAEVIPQLQSRATSSSGDEVEAPEEEPSFE